MEKRKPGRPANGSVPLVALRLPLETRQAVLAWAKDQPDQPDLSEAMRRLINLGLVGGIGTTPARVPAKASDKPDSKEKVGRAGPIALPRQATQLKPGAPAPAEDMKPYEMPEDIEAFNEFWMKTEQGLERPLEYEEIIVLFNREREASEHVSDHVERRVH